MAWIDDQLSESAAREGAALREFQCKKAVMSIPAGVTVVLARQITDQGCEQCHGTGSIYDRTTNTVALCSCYRIEVAYRLPESTELTAKS